MLRIPLAPEFSAEDSVNPLTNSLSEKLDEVSFEPPITSVSECTYTPK